MRLDAKHSLAGLAVLALALPLWARAGSTSMRLDNRATIAGKQFEPGDYQLSATEGQNELAFKRDATVVAQVPCQWIKLKNKSPDSDVIPDKNQIVAVEFDGKMEAVKVR